MIPPIAIRSPILFLAATLSACTIVERYPDCDATAPRVVREATFEVRPTAVVDSPRLRPAHACATADGLHVRAYVHDTHPWFIDLERSFLTSFDGVRRSLEHGGDGMLPAGKALDAYFAATDRALLEADPDRLVGRTATLDLALVSASGERAIVRVTARVARVEVRRGRLM